MREATWTVAVRKPKANRFLRAGNWSGTWREALTMATVVSDADPSLDVWYVPTRESELRGFVPDEDVRNVLAGSGRRVRIFDGYDLMFDQGAYDVALAAELARST